MKFLNFISISLLTFLSIALFSCSKDDDLTSQIATLSDDIQKIETALEEGSAKNENLKDGPKTETKLNNRLVEKIRLELQESYSKQESYLKSGSNLVGVLKNGSCGNYPELSIYMDCEDSRSASRDYGWTGSSMVTGAKNIRLKFCVVNNAYFERTNVDFAILRITSDKPAGINIIERYFDNEDNSNANSVSYNGNNISGWLGPNHFGGNTRLSFLYYPKRYANDWPNLGISYGVLGRFGSNQGYIHSDDEDRKNANWCYMDKWTGYSWDYQPSGDIPNIMNVGSNTRLYTSKVN